VASAISENPYRSRRSLLLSKLGLKESQPATAFTIYGNETEDIALEKYKARVGCEVVNLGLMVHPTHRWLGASPDGVTHDGVLVEIKCPVKRQIVPGEVPSYYMPQLQTLMEVLDLPRCDFVQYSPASDWCEEILDITSVPRDPEWWAAKFPLMQGFWDEWQEIEGRMKADEGYRARIVAEWAVKNERKGCKRPARPPARLPFLPDAESEAWR